MRFWPFQRKEQPPSSAEMATQRLYMAVGPSRMVPNIDLDQITESFAQILRPYLDIGPEDIHTSFVPPHHKKPACLVFEVPIQH